MATLRFDQASILDTTRWSLKVFIRGLFDKLENEPGAASLWDALSWFLTDDRRPDNVDLPVGGLTDEAIRMLESEFTDLGEQLRETPGARDLCDSVVRALEDAREERRSAQHAGRDL